MGVRLAYSISRVVFKKKFNSFPRGKPETEIENQFNLHLHWSFQNV